MEIKTYKEKGPINEILGISMDRVRELIGFVVQSTLDAKGLKKLVSKCNTIEEVFFVAESQGVLNMKYLMETKMENLED